ncbi:ligand-binding sensor domain-containing protein [Spirosoma fluminis]
MSGRSLGRVLILLAFLSGFGRGIAQQRPAQFEFRHIQEKDGLSFNLINCFLQDRDGFLWIGTFDGLNRYDGGHFITFKHQRNNPNSLLHNTVHDLCEDGEGNIWMAVENGICCYVKATGQFRNIVQVDKRPLGFCNNVLTDRNGDVWFTSYMMGLYRYQTKTGTITCVSQTRQNMPLTVTSRISKNGLVQDPTRNGLWMADRSGLQYIDVDQLTFQNHRNNPQQLPIFQEHYTSALALDGERLIFADNTDQQIITYDLRRRQIVSQYRPVTQSKRDVFDIATIFVDRQHNLWTSSWNYILFHVETSTGRMTQLMHDGAQATSIAADFFWTGWQQPDGSVWLGTVNGISCTNPEQAFYDVYDLGAMFPPLNDERGIVQILEDSDRSWWLGTSIRGLMHYVSRRNQLAVYKLPDATAKYPYGLPVVGLVEYEDDLYVGTQYALFRFNKQTKTFTNIPMPTGTNPNWRSYLRQQNRLWVSGKGKQVLCYDLDTSQWTTYSIRSSSDDPRFTVRYSLVDHNNTVWLDLYPEGFARLSAQHKAFLLEGQPERGDYEREIASFTQDRDGYFWLAANGYGLIRYNPIRRQYRNWTESEGLGYDHCWAALPDRFGNIWVGAYNKFSVFTPAKNRFFNFSLPFSEANLEYINILAPLRNGHILAALKGYVIEFKPEKLIPKGNRERVLINSLTLPDTTQLLQGPSPSVQLKSTDNAFTIQYSVLSPLNQHPYRYIYKLEGYDDAWIDVGAQTVAAYGRLPGGDYTFSVKAVAANGLETPVSTVAIHIDTPFYRTDGFWTLVIMIGLGLFLGFIRYRADQTAKLHNLQVQASRLERDKTEIQYQNLINHLNPHFLFNSLTSLNSLIITNPRQASQFLRKLSVIYRYILQNKDKELVSLTEELNFVQHYIDLQTARFNEGIQFIIDVAEADLDYRIVPVTIQNLLENAIKHNIIADESPLIIRIFTDANQLCVANTLQRKSFVESSNKQGLASLRSLYQYLSQHNIEISETDTEFIVKVPLL